LDDSEKTMLVGGEYTLTATCDKDSPITWSSSDETVATVDENGKVTAVSVGTATITATASDNGKQTYATCTVTVETAVTISLGDSELSIKAGEKYTLTADVSKDVAITWSSSDETVVTVDENGKLTAVGAGEATITATVTENGQQISAECRVTVTGTGSGNTDSEQTSNKTDKTAAKSGCGGVVGSAILPAVAALACVRVLRKKKQDN
jgi:uncharacterized protein YjdB